jgi:hypothetical protein
VAYDKINVPPDAGGVTGYNPQNAFQKFDFYRKHKIHLDCTALISRDDFQQSFLRRLDRSADTDMKRFLNEGTDEARKWIFPSRLP